MQVLLFVTGNNINFEGLPTGIGKLYNLVILAQGTFQKSGLMRSVNLRMNCTCNEFILNG